MKFSLSLLALGLTGLVALTTTPAQAALPKVAILGAPGNASWNTDVQAKIAATGLFSAVDLYNISASIPSLATLQTYSSVLFYTDSGVQNSVALGNELDTYLRGGGGVVDAVFANASIAIGGAYQSNKDYSIVPAYQSQGTDLTLVKINAGSPLLAGVKSLDGGSSSYRSTGALNPSSTLVANWSDGSPLVAYQKAGAGTEVSLNLYPPSSDVRGDFWRSNTDGGRLMGNALRFASGNSSDVPEPGAYATVASLGLSGAAFLRRRRAR